MPLKALIFDFDGLILDTETPEVRAWQKIFRSKGAEFPDAWWMNAIGRGADQITEHPCDLLDRQLGYPCLRSEVNAEYEQLRMSAIEASETLPGIRDLIIKAKEAGLKLGVASSSKHVWVDRHLTRLGLFDSFEAIVCADDVELAKPHPDLYLSVCALLGVDPTEAVALEDSPNGIKAAKAAGLFCIVIPNSCTIQLNLSEADHRVDSAKELSLETLHNLPGIAARRYAQRMAANPQGNDIQTHFDGIVAELKAVGLWDIEQPSEEAVENMGAFGEGTMAYEQWLRWIFIPVIEQKLATDGPWPSESNVGIMAIRNFDGQHERSDLTTKLCEFDGLF